MWNVISISCRVSLKKKSDSFWGHVLLFGVLWPHSVLNAFLAVESNAHIELLAPPAPPKICQDSASTNIWGSKKSSRDKILLGIRLFLWAFLWTFLWAFCSWPGMTATWHLVSGWHPFFAWNDSYWGRPQGAPLRIRVCCLSNSCLLMQQWSMHNFWTPRPSVALTTPVKRLFVKICRILHPSSSLPAAAGSVPAQVGSLQVSLPQGPCRH